MKVEVMAGNWAPKAKVDAASVACSPTMSRYGPMALTGSSGKLTVLNGRTRPLISDG